MKKITTLALSALLSLSLFSCDENQTAGEKLEEQLEMESETMEERSDDLDDASDEIDDAVDDIEDAIDNFRDALDEVDNAEDREKIRMRIMKILEMNEMKFQTNKEGL